MATPILNADVKGTNEAKPTLVLVHGVAGSLHIWDPVIEGLARDYRVVRVDLLGYGHSPKPRIRYTPTEHVAAIRATLQARGLRPPYTLVGLSMGVTLVLCFAKLFPDEVASIVAIGYPYYPTRDAARRGLRHNIWAGLTITRPIIAQLVIPPIWFLGRIGILPAHSFTKIYSPLMSHETLLNPYRVFRSNVWNSMVNVDAQALLQASAAKRRLFLHGSLDRWAPADEVRNVVARYPNTRFECIPNQEHNLVVLTPDVTLRLILDFLEA